MYKEIESTEVIICTSVSLVLVLHQFPQLVSYSCFLQERDTFCINENNYPYLGNYIQFTFLEILYLLN